ncbi:3-deoxy-manno-octulosonate cytidylyltransferase [Rhizobium lentis]|uniref:3-deoxy-manno-octulosonate cytidylyltransferase n=1 Tax=Rhizobium lentis TaxID=1138194 RepID=A0A9Q3M859_9HYPH|nr:3-deoxy-manno-octulosonate cytidylyltransferase [Rhizobium lentis]MBX4999960.1 3-deoxy-manno-octulosonate cytidylyltransferase [Rhizobium lentis]MBX5011855.1 3-deoxy-manno-octulosonate cytidylyltransferase [Rhizobium lentis]MBX5014754.1 3-deoxy-manno-octulosonate cytidylyltransferase [Rhizobium lentis]MBX5022319.1 3-deoxy-manno-octulosonate cytidylyltransferase [Rhizobium lentis]MBX5046317.1 3-deoxy-manno-octulosonate cytidylyltransferase [Rhizobium lentis]
MESIPSETQTMATADDGFNVLTPDAWKALLSRYSHIVLVANSEAVDFERLLSELPESALYVFFNNVYKVLDEPFAGHAVLVARSGVMGANIVHRREVGDVLRFFAGDDFLGVVNIRVSPEENFSEESGFKGAKTRHLDLTQMLGGLYPTGKIATSGFAMALWLAELQLPGKILLAGFSAKRSEKWKVFDVHDWTYEQIFLRLFSRMGAISMMGGVDASPYAALAKRFPQVPPIEIAMTAAEVLSERLHNANGQIDRLMSVTKSIRAIENFFRRFKPKTRKERFLEKSKQ